MEFKKADDPERIIRFYQDAIERTEDMAVYGRWVYGLHPTDGMIRGYLESGCLYTLEENGSILAAVAVTLSQGEDYHPVRWQTDAADDEVAVVHILCVDPARQRQGVAKECMRSVAALAQAAGKKAVRLDALACNTPAHRLYEALGYKKRGVQSWYASNTGQTDFFLYEYVLPAQADR